MHDALEALSYFLKICYPIHLYFGNFAYHTEFNRCHTTTDISYHIWRIQPNKSCTNFQFQQLPSGKRPQIQNKVFVDLLYIFKCTVHC